MSETAVNTFVPYHKAGVCLDSNKCTRNRGINDNILSDILAFLDDPGQANTASCILILFTYLNSQITQHIVNVILSIIYLSFCLCVFLSVYLSSFPSILSCSRQSSCKELKGQTVQGFSEVFIVSPFIFKTEWRLEELKEFKSLWTDNRSKPTGKVFGPLVWSEASGSELSRKGKQRLRSGLDELTSTQMVIRPTWASRRTGRTTFI